MKRLTTISGVAALSIVAAVGDFHRFSSPQRLVSYLGLNPRVRQSGGQPAQHGRIAKQGRAHARGMLVEAAWMAAKIKGPLRAFFERVRARRGMQIAVVATARKLAVLCWYLVVRGEDYAFQRPSLTEKKLRARVSAPPPCPRGAVRRAKRPPTRSRRCAGVRALSPSRASRATGSSSPTGRRKPPPQERARVPPLGSGSEAVKRQSCAAGFPSPRPALRSGVTRARDDSTTGGAPRQLTFSSVQPSPAGTSVSRAGKTSSGWVTGWRRRMASAPWPPPARRWPAGPSACTRSLPMTAWHTRFPTKLSHRG